MVYVEYVPNDFQFVVTVNGAELSEYNLPFGTPDIDFGNVTVRQSTINFLGFTPPGKVAIFLAVEQVH